MEAVHAHRESHLLPDDPVLRDAAITFSTRILRSYLYIERIISDGLVDSTQVEMLCGRTPLARYLGIIRLESPYFGRVDVLIDTTGTLRTAYCLAVIRLGIPQPYTQVVVERLVETFKGIAIL